MAKAAAQPDAVVKKARKEKKVAAAAVKAAPVVKAKKLKQAASTGEEEAPKKKKRKASTTGAEEPVKKKKKAKTEDPPPSSGASDSADSEQFLAEVLPPEAEPEAAAPADPLALDNFRLSEGVKGLLREKGIHSLFSIQAQTLNHVLDGNDLVGRARYIFLHALSLPTCRWHTYNGAVQLHGSCAWAGPSRPTLLLMGGA
jgi:ATP-dependent RNA helicase DDX21